MPRLFIGMPVKDGERFLAAALDSLRAQEFQDWTLLVSDNASSDGTAGICAGYAAKDPRIRVVRQARDLGALGNFQYLAGQASGDFFMWAAADDLWEPAFTGACVRGLDRDPGCSMAFSNLVNIDTYGRRVREYPSFARFLSGDPARDIETLLADPEIMGKANLIYSMYRTAFLKDLLKRQPFVDCWGGDMVFVLAALARTRLALDERTLFQKRMALPEDSPQEAHLVRVGRPGDHVFPLRGSLAYLNGCRRALKGTPYHLLGVKVLTGRLGRELARSVRARFKRL